MATTTTTTIILSTLLGTATVYADTIAVDDPPVASPEVRPPGAVPVRAVRRVESDPNLVGPWGGGVAVMGLSGIGALPGVNVGGEVGAYLRHEELFGSLALSRWKPQEPVVVSEVPKRSELGLDAWAFRVGWASHVMPLRAWVLGEIGELATGPHGGMPNFLARSMTVSVPSERRWSAVGGGFSVAWPMSRYARLVGAVEFAVPIDHKQMTVERGTDNGKPYEPGTAVARANFGLEVGWR